MILSTFDASGYTNGELLAVTGAAIRGVCQARFVFESPDGPDKLFTFDIRLRRLDYWKIINFVGRSYNEQPPKTSSSNVQRTKKIPQHRKRCMTSSESRMKMMTNCSEDARMMKLSKNQTSADRGCVDIDSVDFDDVTVSTPNAAQQTLATPCREHISVTSSKYTPNREHSLVTSSICGDTMTSVRSNHSTKTWSSHGCCTPPSLSDKIARSGTTLANKSEKLSWLFSGVPTMILAGVFAVWCISFVLVITLYPDNHSSRLYSF